MKKINSVQQLQLEKAKLKYEIKIQEQLLLGMQKEKHTAPPSVKGQLQRLGVQVISSAVFVLIRRLSK